ncbi:hypothetical protein GCM10025880_24660 [Methylorubrum aminovorans]|nr:hypothetical protein GCM10025880_24660 [Methylorubrum aminovorans]
MRSCRRLGRRRIVEELGAGIDVLGARRQNFDDDDRLRDCGCIRVEAPPTIDESIGLEARGSIDSNGDAVREDAAWKASGVNRRSKCLIGRELGFSVPDAFRRDGKDLAIDEFVPSRPAFGPDQELVEIHAG